MSGAQLVRDIKDVIEDQLERNLSPKKLRRALDALGPFFLVLTYVEDAMRVLLRFGEQRTYMNKHMRFPMPVAVLLLTMSFVAQLAGSLGVVSRTQVRASCGALIVWTMLQPLLYGQHGESEFVCRSCTQVGGLLLLLRHEAQAGRRRGSSDQDALFGEHRRETSWYGLTGSHVQLLGRSLLMLMFFLQGGRHLASRGLGVAPVLGYLTLMSLCALVIAGFKARWSAVILAISLAITNVWMYPFWAVPARQRDFNLYYFFNTLSMIGGLLLLVSHGPGGLSVDNATKKGI